MKKQNKKTLRNIGLSLLTLGIVVPSTIIPISCSSAKEDPTINYSPIYSLTINGNTNLNEHETLNIQSNIEWKDYPITNISYEWVVTKANGQKLTRNDKDLMINNIDMSYNGATVALNVILNNESNNKYSSNTLKISVLSSSINQYISIRQNSAHLSNLSEKIASDLWNDSNQIKQVLIKNKEIFFKLNDPNFDLNQNLQVTYIYKNQQESDAGKLSFDIKINNIDADKNSLNDKILIQGFKSDNPLNNAILGYDFFVLPNKSPDEFNNRITNIFTKNDDVIQKYGNAPLPWVDDSQITQQDIVNMFSYLCFYAKATTITFGQRKINANLFIPAFFEWCTKYHKYFPYKSFDNTPPYFYGISNKGEMSSEINTNELNTDEYINNRTWYIHSVNWPNYDEIYEPGQKRDDFLRFITKLFRYVQPNMSDVEKLFLCENFVMNWLFYDGKKETPPFDNRGVCANYANLLAYALQILDVPSVAIDCGSQAEPHAIVWTYLDLHGNGQKKWYASDMTWGDYDTLEVGDVEGLAGLALANPSKSWYLFDVGVDQFTPIDTVNPTGDNPWQHDISNKIYGLPWSDIGQNKSPIGLASYGEEDNYVGKYFDYMFSSVYDDRYEDRACMRSRTFYLNGYSYYFQRDTTSPNNISLFKVKCLIGQSPEKVPIELDKKFMDKFSFDSRNGDMYQTTYPPLVQQFGNKLAILLNPKKSNDNNYQRSILLINTNNNGIDWNNVQEFKIPSQIDGINLNENYIFNMDIEWDGMLRLDYAPSYSGLNNINFKTIMIDLGDQFKQTILFNSNTNNRKGDLDIAVQYFTALISAYRVGDKNGYISFHLRKQFFDYMKSQQQTNNNYYQAIRNIYDKYMELSSTIFQTSSRVIQSKLIDNVYFVTNESFKYGFSFNGFNVFNSPDDMLNLSNAAVKYNVYFSKIKPNSANDLNLFTKVINGADSPYLNIEVLKKHGFNDPNGYCYFEIIGKKEEVIRSNVCEIKVCNDDMFVQSNLAFYSDSLPTQGTTRITNYTDRVNNWYDDKLIFNFEICYNQLLFPSEYQLNVELKYINIDTKEIKIVKDNNYFEQYNRNGTIKGKIELDILPNEQNHGIYYLEISSKNLATNKVIKSYSKFNFVLTNNDYINWNKDIWIDTINKISIYK